MKISSIEELDDRYYQRLRVGALFAGVSAGLLYLSLGTVSILTGTRSVVDFFRFAIAIFIILYSILFYALVSKKVRFSEVFVGISSFLFIGTVPVIAYFSSKLGMSLAPWLTTSIILGLFLHYSVLNLRAGISLIFGLSSTLVAWLFFINQAGSEAARSLVFLVAANFVGYYVVRKSMESNEAEFLARSQMKENWSKLREMRGFFKDEILEHKRWVGAFSHEINQPLYLASSLIQRIAARDSRTQGIDEDLLHLVGEVKFHLDDIGVMFDVLLRQAKNPHDFLNIRLSWMNLSNLLEDAVLYIQKERGLVLGEIKINLDGFESLCLYTDGYLMRRILRNLLENSIKFAGYEAERVLINFATDESCKKFVIKVFNTISDSIIDFRVSRHADGHFKTPSGLGLGLGVGHRFITRVNRALPGQRTRIRVVKDRFAVARISFSEGYFEFCRPMGLDSGLRGYPSILVCSDDRDFIKDCSLYISRLGLPMNACGFEESSELIMSGEAFSSPQGNGLLILEVAQGFLSSFDYFGAALREKILSSGRYVFVSNFTLDESYAELGLCIKREDLNANFIKSLIFDN